MRREAARALNARWMWVGLGLAAGLAVSQQPALAALAVVGGVLVAVGVNNPQLLVAGMFVSILFDRLGVTGMKVDSFPITASKLSVLGSIGLWGVHSALKRAPLVRWHSVLSAMVGVVATAGVCVAWTGSLKAGKFTLFGLAMMTVLVALVYAILAERPLRPLYRFLGLALSAAVASTVIAGRGGSGEAGRATGTMGDPNEWASMILLLGPFVLGGLVEDDHWTARPLRMALMALIPAGVLLSGSRASLLVGALIAPACVYLLWHRREEMFAVGGAGILAGPFVLELEPTLARLESLVKTATGGVAYEDQSLSERTELLHQGWALFMDHWLIGAGPGNFASATGFISQDGRLRPAHNTYLEIASEQGLIGLTAAAIFMATVAVTLYYAWRGARRYDDRAQVFGAAVGLGALSLMAATLGLLTFSMGYLVLGASLAVCARAESGRIEAERAEAGRADV